MTLPEPCCLAQVSEKFGSGMCPIQVPIGDCALFDPLGRITNITKPKQKERHHEKPKAKPEKRADEQARPWEAHSLSRHNTVLVAGVTKRRRNLLDNSRPNGHRQVC